MMEANEFWCRAFLAAMGASYVDETRRGVVHSQMADYAGAAADAALSVASERGMVTGEPAGRSDVEPAEAERVEFTAERDGREPGLWEIRSPGWTQPVQVRAGGERHYFGPLETLRVKWAETSPPKPLGVWLERRVLALEGRTASIERAEQRVLEAARQWARVKKLGHCLEGGSINHITQSDRADAEEMFLGEFRRAALDLLNLEAKPR